MVGACGEQRSKAVEEAPTVHGRELLDRFAGAVIRSYYSVSELMEAPICQVTDSQGVPRDDRSADS